jgi:hypothetical protein
MYNGAKRLARPPVFCFAKIQPAGNIMEEVASEKHKKKF